jgi:hypothetical protein
MTQDKSSASDGLTVTENEDGSFTLEWDENDPRYSVFNGLEEEEITAMIEQGLQQFINRENDL